MGKDIKRIFTDDVREKRKARPKAAIAKKKPKVVITPYDLNKKDRAYRPGPVRISVLPRCAGCNGFFEKQSPRQKYCSVRCRERVRKRAQRHRRLERGLCTHCGRPFDNGNNALIIYPKRPARYCRTCQEYWQKRYKRLRIRPIPS